MTALDLISSSLRLLGVLATGENASASEAKDGLVSLNDLIDSWSTQNLLIPNKVSETFPLVVGQKTYTMGAGGNFNTSRPQRIENALIQFTGNNPVLDMPMKLLNQDEYSSILLKTQESTFPMYLYSDNAYPLTNISVWPVPDAANNIVLYSWKPLASLAALTTSPSLPPGYGRALRYNLAVELAPEYGKQIPPSVEAIAMESKAEIKRMNFAPQYLQVDRALRAKPAVWNWLTGEPT